MQCNAVECPVLSYTALFCAVARIHVRAMITCDADVSQAVWHPYFISHRVQHSPKLVPPNSQPVVVLILAQRHVIIAPHPPLSPTPFNPSQ